MGEGLTTELGIGGLIIGIACLWIAMRELPFSAALAITAIRVSIPIAYFAWYFDGSWILLDDLAYYEGAIGLLDSGNTSLNLLSADGFDSLANLAGGRHTIYFWWNVVAITLFGEHYYSAVLLNVVATFVGAHFFVNMLRTLGFNRSYRRWAQAFLLLHWEIVTWTSFVNLKDPLVYVLTIAALAAAIRFYQTRSIKSLLAFLVVCCLFETIRFYVPVLIFGAISIWMICHWRGSLKYCLLLVFGGLSIHTFATHGGAFQEYLSGSFLYGTLRFTLTPLPWKLMDSYSFQLISCALHLVFAVPAVLGMIVLWRESTTARLVIIYLAIILCFYGAGDALQGPRHRVQVSFIFAWVQFHFLWRTQNVSERPTLPQNKSTRVDRQHKLARPRRAVTPSPAEVDAHV